MPTERARRTPRSKAGDVTRRGCGRVDETAIPEQAAPCAVQIDGAFLIDQRSLSAHSMKLLPALTLFASLFAASAHAQNVPSGSGCGGFTIGFSGAPQIGSSYTLSCSGGSPGAVAALFIGQPDPVGLDLSIIGMTSCSLYINPAALATISGVVLDGTGAFSTVVSVANNPGDIGVVLGQQFASIKIGANVLGVVTTDLLTTTIQ